MAKPTLLFVVNGARFFLSHRSNLALHAKACGWQVHVATPVDDDVAAIRAMGFTHHALNLSRSGGNPLAEFRTIARLAGMIRTVKPDLIHAVTIKPVLYSGMLGRLLNVRCLVMAVSGLGHVFTSEGTMASVRRYIVNMMYRTAFGHRNARVIFQNPADMQTLLPRLGKAQAVLIPGAGVDPDVFYPRPIPEGIPVVILAGRLLWSKGVGVFVEAARCLQQEGVQVRFVIAGEPDPENPDSVTAGELEGWHRCGLIEWLGRREDMPEVFAEASVVCSPTYYGEGIPKVLIEAAMAGRAIVATDWPGCREIVEHGVNGLLVEPKNCVQLAQALGELAQSRMRCVAMGDEGRKKALAGFTEKEVVQQTFDVYHELIAMP